MSIIFRLMDRRLIRLGSFLFLLLVVPVTVLAALKWYGLRSYELRSRAVSKDVLIEESPELERPTLVYPYKIPVLVISYFPDVNNDRVLDPEETGMHNWLIDSIRKEVKELNSEVSDALERGSIYHGYKDSLATPSLDYQIVEEKEFIKPIPKQKGHADHIKILTREGFNICDYVENRGVREVWLWMYHTDRVYPIESYQLGPYGGVGNGYMDLPLCEKTYTVYDYNYDRGVGEALENHTHHLEHVFRWVDSEMLDGKFIGWEKDQDAGLQDFYRCGWTHCPPNVMEFCSMHGYDWCNKRTVLSDCEDWTPDGSGEKTEVNCYTWDDDCHHDCEDFFKIWWMQNVPGKYNRIYDDGEKLRNWWEFVGDFDQAMEMGRRLVYDPSVLDSDFDGVPDFIDNCPNNFNPDQGDSDAEGIGDVCDNCPDAANPDQLDSDADEIGDICDNCPNDYNPGQEDLDGEGTGDICQRDWSDAACSNISDFRDIHNRFGWGQDGADTRFGTEFDYETSPQENDGDDGVTLDGKSLEGHALGRGESYTLKVVSNSNYNPPQTTAKGWVDWDGVGGNPPQLIMDYSYPYVMFDNSPMPVEITVPDYAKDQVCFRFINKYYISDVYGYNDNTHSGEVEDYVVDTLSCNAEASILNEKCEPSLGENYKISWTVKGYADSIETWVEEQEESHLWCQNLNLVRGSGGDIIQCEKWKDVPSSGRYHLIANSHDYIGSTIDWLFNCHQERKIVTCNPCVTDEGVFCRGHDNKFRITGSFSWPRFQSGSDRARAVVKDKGNNPVYESPNNYSGALTFWHDVSQAGTYYVKGTVYDKNDQELCSEEREIKCEI